MMPGMPDLGQIVLQAQQMQAEMERAQASLAESEVTGSAGGGLVTAVVNGSGDLLRLRIDPSVVDPADIETLEDLIVAAVHDARRVGRGHRQHRDGLRCRLAGSVVHGSAGDGSARASVPRASSSRTSTTSPTMTMTRTTMMTISRTKTTTWSTRSS